MSFELEQEDFSVEAAPETRERSVRADDAVAGKGDAEGIGPHGLRNGTECRRPTDGARDVAVGRGLPVRHLEERPPDGFLKGRSAGTKRQVEGLETPGKVVFERLDGLFENGGVARRRDAAEAFAERRKTMGAPGASGQSQSTRASSVAPKRIVPVGVSISLRVSVVILGKP